MSDLNRDLARRIVDTVGSSGYPPQYGAEHFTAGLDPYLSVIDEEYLSTFIRQGGSAFKMVVGTYGGGKTHFLYCVRDLAWDQRYAVSYVSLSSKECPFHRLDLVYQAIVRGILYPVPPEERYSGYEQGISSFIRSWFAEEQSKMEGRSFQGEDFCEGTLIDPARFRGIESISFKNAIRAAYTSLAEDREDDFESICQWLNGEGCDKSIAKRFRIMQRIDKTTAFSMVRSLVQWIREIGLCGLVVLLDEAEQRSSISTKDRAQHLSNLRELIDECGHTNFQSVLIFYAVPDDGFLEGRTQVYEALKQRVSTVFNELNPTGVRINLEELVKDPISFLAEVGDKLARVYEVAYDCTLDGGLREETIKAVAELAFEKRYSDIGYKRLFVKNLIKGFNKIRKSGASFSPEDLEVA